MQTKSDISFRVNELANGQVGGNDAEPDEERRLTGSASGGVVCQQEGRETRSRREAGRSHQGRLRRRSNYTLAGTIKEDQQQAQYPRLIYI